MNNYYYLDANNEAVGPHTTEELAELARGEIITGSTLVAADGDQEWQPWRSIDRAAQAGTTASPTAALGAIARKVPAPAALPADTRCCPACATRNESDAKFCYKCGAQIGDVPPPMRSAGVEPLRAQASAAGIGPPPSVTPPLRQPALADKAALFAPPPLPKPATKVYFCLTEAGQPTGPHTIKELTEMARIGQINVETLVAADGDQEWKPWKMLCQTEAMLSPKEQAGELVQGLNGSKPPSAYGDTVGIGTRAGGLVFAILFFFAPFVVFGVLSIPMGTREISLLKLLSEAGSIGPLIVVALVVGVTGKCWHLAAGALRTSAHKNPRQIHRLAEQGDLAGVKAQLASGIDINGRDPYGNTPLQIAAYQGHLSLVSAFIAAGANPNLKDKNGGTPLSKAAGNGHCEVVSTLLAAGADMESMDGQGGTPLHQAAFEGRTKVINLLIEAGADKDAANTKMGVTPLHLAAAFGHREAVAALLNRGVRTDVRDNERRTALDLARQKGQTEIVAMLNE